MFRDLRWFSYSPMFREKIIITWTYDIVIFLFPLLFPSSPSHVLFFPFFSSSSSLTHQVEVQWATSVMSENVFVGEWESKNLLVREWESKNVLVREWEGKNIESNTMRWSRLATNDIKFKREQHRFKQEQHQIEQEWARATLILSKRARARLLFRVRASVFW